MTQIFRFWGGTETDDEPLSYAAEPVVFQPLAVADLAGDVPQETIAEQNAALDPKSKPVTSTATPAQEPLIPSWAWWAAAIFAGGGVLWALLGDD